MSNINPNNIDGTFPIAGQDNSSQGFRDNFTNIRNNFSYAQSEISDLQSKVLLTSPLVGGTLTNNMSYNQLQYAQLFSPSYTFLNIGTPTSGSTITLDYSQGGAQKFTTNGNYTISFSNWPASGQLGRILLWVNVTDKSHTLTFPITSPGILTTSLNDIAGASITNGKLTFDQTGNWLFEFYSSDNGNSIAMVDLTRNSSTLRDPNFYWNDSNLNTFLIGFGQNQYSFQNAQNILGGQDIVAAQGSFNSVSVGNINLANISYPVFDTGAMAGYSVSSFRGNLQTGVPGTYTTTSNGDFLGYVNSITYTGNQGVGSTFAQVSSIGFYATGSNALAGLGGNIAMFTHVPGTTSNTVVQAVGIENDQSIKMFGNVTHSAGFVDQGYQYSAPTTSFWTVITPGKSRMIFDPTTTIAQGNVTLPNCTVDGTIVSVHSTAAITLFGANSQQTSTVVKPSTGFTLAAGTGVEYFYHLSENTWYKIR